MARGQEVLRKPLSLHAAGRRRCCRTPAGKERVPEETDRNPYECQTTLNDMNEQNMREKNVNITTDKHKIVTMIHANESCCFFMYSEDQN